MMRSKVKEGAMARLIQDIIRLDCQSLPTKFGSNSSFLSNRPRQTRVASLSTIRALLVTFGNLHSNLNSICKSQELNEYYEYRRPLTERVLPESIFAFEYCRQTLSLKGATQSPIATRLATLANDVCDYVELIRERINIAMEYHELKNIVLGDIHQFATKANFSTTDIGPLMFSLTVSLPLRLEAFAKSASSSFPDSVSQLYKTMNEITAQAKNRSKTIQDKDNLASNRETNQANKAATKAAKQQSPIRHKLRPLRGVKYRQPLTSVHQRIPSLQEEELKKALTSPSNANKENLMRSSPKLISPRNKVRPLLANDSSSKNILSSTPRGKLKRITRCSPAKPSDKPREVSTSKLKQPTKVENRKVSQPLPNEPPILRKQPSTRSLSSRVSRPTIIAPRKSIQQLRRSSLCSNPEYKAPRTLNSNFERDSSPSNLSSSDLNSSNLSSSNISSDFYVTTPAHRTNLALPSPEGSIIEETPLSRKGSRIGSGLPLLQPRTSSSDLYITRRRKRITGLASQV